MAIQIPNGRQQFFSANGFPLVGGSVTFYVPGTTTLKATYQDAAGTILNTNPIILDSSGSATIWGDGTYRQVVADANGNQIWDQVTSASTAGASSGFPSGISVAGSGVVVTAGGASITGDTSINGALTVNNSVLTVNNPTGPSLVLEGNPGTSRALFLRSNTSTPDRWIVGADSSAETGGNAGSNYFWNRYADDGSLIDSVASITRSDGSLHLSHNLIVGGATLQTNGDLYMPVLGSYLSTYVAYASGAGWQQAPGGLLVQWGQNNVGGSSGTQNYPIAFPHGVGFIGVTPFNPGSVLNVSSSNAIGFNWGTTGATGFYFMAVGN